MRSEEGKFQNSRRIQGDSGEEKIQGGRVKFKEISRRIQGCINPVIESTTFFFGPHGNHFSKNI